MGRPLWGKGFLHLVVLVLLATAVLSDKVEVSDPNLDQQIKAAEEKQEEREEAVPVVAQLIKEAPGAVLNAGTGDISTAGLILLTPYHYITFNLCVQNPLGVQWAIPEAKLTALSWTIDIAA
jgi:hypothetical protein